MKPTDKDLCDKSKITYQNKGSDSKERIAKKISRSGLCSRRIAEKWILEGRVKINDDIINSPAINVSKSDKIYVDGILLPCIDNTRLWIYNKPRGLITTNNDPQDRPTIFSELPKYLPRVMTIGRLDINTEGLLLLTNDGQLSRILELPSTGWIRCYRVRAFGKIKDDTLKRLNETVMIDGIEYGPMQVSLENTQGDNNWFTVNLKGGKNREIKRIFNSVDLQINRLIRISFGNFGLGSLATGSVVEISSKDLQKKLGKKIISENNFEFENGDSSNSNHRKTFNNRDNKGSNFGRSKFRKTSIGEERYGREDRNISDGIHQYKQNDYKRHSFKKDLQKKLGKKIISENNFEFENENSSNSNHRKTFNNRDNTGSNFGRSKFRKTSIGEERYGREDRNISDGIHQYKQNDYKRHSFKKDLQKKLGKKIISENNFEFENENSSNSNHRKTFNNRDNTGSNFGRSKFRKTSIGEERYGREDRNISDGIHQYKQNDYKRHSFKKDLQKKPGKKIISENNFEFENENSSNSNHRKTFNNRDNTGSNFGRSKFRKTSIGEERYGREDRNISDGIHQYKQNDYKRHSFKKDLQKKLGKKIISENNFEFENGDSSNSNHRKTFNNRDNKGSNFGRSKFRKTSIGEERYGREDRNISDGIHRYKQNDYKRHSFKKDHDSKKYSDVQRSKHKNSIIKKDSELENNNAYGKQFRGKSNTTFGKIRNKSAENYSKFKVDRRDINSRIKKEKY